MSEADVRKISAESLSTSGLHFRLPCYSVTQVLNISVAGVSEQGKALFFYSLETLGVSGTERKESLILSFRYGPGPYT